jgi:alpha-galactosidase
MSDAVTFDPKQKLFILRTSNSFYAMRILPEGQLVHVGFGPMPTPVEPMLLSSLDAYEDPNYVWEQQGRRWEYPTFGDVQYHDVALKVAFPQPATALEPGEAKNIPVRDLRLRYVRHEIGVDAQPGLAPEHGRDNNPVRPALMIELRDIAYDFIVRLFYRVTADCDVFERWVELENLPGSPGPVAVEALAFATLHLPTAPYELMTAAGCWGREFVPQQRDLLQGVTILRQLGLNTGHAVNPSFMIRPRGENQLNAGDTYFGLLAFSGNWSLCCEVLPTDALSVHGGYERGDFALTLPPGGTHRTPAFIFGVSGQGGDGASDQLHDFFRRYVLPVSAHAPVRPVLYNGWEAVYFDMSMEKQLRLARAAAALGVELFCMDDGWFTGRRGDRIGLGDWTVDRTIFPQGLAELIHEVKQLGMRFGLWVEPEMVNADSDLYRAHPDWVLHYPGRPRTEARHQLILDFGRPEVVQHIFTMLDALLAGHDITFFKWDMNRYATEAGSVAGREIWYRHVRGVYSIMDQLLKKYPQLEIQSCSGGGGRVDAGILGRCVQVWTSDNTDAQDRVYIQDGFSLFYPPCTMESWVTHERNHQTGRVIPLDVRFDVAMRGVLGIGTNIDTLSPEELEVYQRKIAFYKKIRPVAQHGRLVRLAQAQQDSVSVWQCVSADGRQSVYSIVVAQALQGHHLPCYRLKHLIPHGVYRITDEWNHEVGRLSGWQLMNLGMPGDQRHGHFGCSLRSRTVLLECL